MFRNQCWIYDTNTISFCTVCLKIPDQGRLEVAQRGLRNETLLEVQQGNLFQVPSYPMCRSISVPWPPCNSFSDYPSMVMILCFNHHFQKPRFCQPDVFESTPRLSTPDFFNSALLLAFSLSGTNFCFVHDYGHRTKCCSEHIPIFYPHLGSFGSFWG